MFSDVQRGVSCAKVYAHCHLSCHCRPLKRDWLHPLCNLPSPVYIHWWDPPMTILFSAKQSQLPQSFLIGKMSQSLSHLCVPLLDSVQYIHACLILGSPELHTLLWVTSETQSCCCLNTACSLTKKESSSSIYNSLHWDHSDITKFLFRFFSCILQKVLFLFLNKKLLEQ